MRSIKFTQNFSSLFLDIIKIMFSSSLLYIIRNATGNKVSNKNYIKNHKWWKLSVQMENRWRLKWDTVDSNLGFCPYWLFILREISRSFHCNKWMAKWNNVTAHSKIQCVLVLCIHTLIFNLIFMFLRSLNLCYEFQLTAGQLNSWWLKLSKGCDVNF